MSLDVMDALLNNRLPDECSIEGIVDLADQASVRVLPRNLTVQGSLILRNCRNLASLPEGLNVSRNLDLSGCTALKELPRLRAGKSLNIDDCQAIIEFVGISATSISARRCTGLKSVREIRCFNLVMSGCSNLVSLPRGLKLRNLNVAGCVRLTQLPSDIRVRSISLARSGLASLPETCRAARLLWHGVTVDWTIAFYPESITALQIVTEENVELRRVLLERFGFERFMNSINADIIDMDVDAGGKRSLLRCPFGDDEDLVCLQVQCPSTTAVYILRVPPNIQTCLEAAAWIAGFNDPRTYRPLVET